MRKHNKRMIYRSILVMSLILAMQLTACRKKTDTTTGNNKAASEQSGDDASSTGDVSISAFGLRDGINQKIEFSSDSNYHSYFTVTVTLPSGVKPSDLQTITLGVDAQSPLELRLYAGNSDVKMSSDTELTAEVTQVTDEVTGTETVTENGASVTKQIHTLSNEVISSTRFVLEEGLNQECTLTVDAQASSVLSNITGNEITFVVYAHNVAPMFGVYELSFTTSSQTVEVDFAKAMVKGCNGGSAKVVTQE